MELGAVVTLRGEEVGGEVGEEVASDRKAKWARAGWREARQRQAGLGGSLGRGLSVSGGEGWVCICVLVQVYLCISLTIRLCRVQSTDFPFTAGLNG